MYMFASKHSCMLVCVYCCACAGVCMRVPFTRVVVKKAVKDTSGHVDIAGVSNCTFLSFSLLVLSVCLTVSLTVCLSIT